MTETKKIDDGGPAFAGGLFEPQHGGTNDREPWNPGMSLRDWFAGQALVAMGTWMPVPASGYPNLLQIETQTARALCAYAQADAMIAARKGGAA
ncbi:hypothetical protein J2T08_000531 [Neorhizobium galegae]|uniref:hypothetical protein n=1 Tax=Neorhizobium galegae TaxID=399 RepID=UPI0027841BDD|nr:hypothetical protein [Neorhizobium galegae]MDQ0132630.1 hypothetical protein [Neorhizobium galegae]